MNTSHPAPIPLDIPDPTQRRIHFQVDRIARQWRLSAADRDDALQTVRLHAIRALRRHDPNRGSQEPLANGAVDLSIREIRRSLKTRARRGYLSWEAHITKHSLVLYVDSSDADTRAKVRLDVHRLMATLSPRLRTLARLLTCATPSQISRVTSRSRTALYRDIERLRRHFRELSPDSRDTFDARAER